MLVLLFVMLFSAVAGATDKASCEILGQRKLPLILLVGDGSPAFWRSEFGENSNASLKSGKKLRALMFKYGRAKKVPLLAQTYLSLDGRYFDDFLPQLKQQVDKDNLIFGIESEPSLALMTNYKLMASYLEDRLSNSAYFRLSQVFFHTLKFPVMKKVWNELYEKSEMFGLGELKMSVRLINNSVIEFEEKYGSSLGKGRATVPREMRDHFENQVSQPLKKKYKTDKIVRKIIESFHYRLVERVNRLTGNRFLFLSPNDSKGEGIKRVLSLVKKHQVKDLNQKIVNNVCRLASQRVVAILVDNPQVPEVRKALKVADDRLVVEVFNGMKVEDRERFFTRMEALLH